MTSNFVLGPFPDQVTRLCYTFMGLKSLAILASANKRLSVDVPACHPDLAKIQAVASRCGRDLGFSITGNWDHHGPYFAIHNPRSDFPCVGWQSHSVWHTELFPDQIRLKNADYTGSSASYLFTDDRRNLHVRNRHGEILATIAASNLENVIHFTPTTGEEQLIMIARLTVKVWDITQIKTPRKLFEHAINDLSEEYYQIGHNYQFGNLLILAPFNSVTFQYPLYSFDLSHPELPPKKLEHPKKYLFDTIEQHSDRLFGAMNDRTHMLAYRITNGDVYLLWENEMTAYGVPKAHLRCASDKWLVCESFSRRRAITGVLVLDAKTGQKRGHFPPIDLHDLTIWGSDILTGQKLDEVHFYRLPLGEPLFVIKQEQYGHLYHKFTDQEELILVHQKSKTEPVRGTSWRAPTPPAPAPSILEQLSSYFTSLLSCIRDIWHWLSEYFGGKGGKL